MEKECLHEIKNMKNAVVFSSKTGNTKQLADEIRNVLPEETIKYFGSPETAPLDADCYYVGFWTDKGHCNAEIGTFLKKIKGKEVFLFGTAGFGRCSESNNSYLLLSGSASGKNEFVSKEAVKLSHRHGNYAILCLCKSKWICKLDFMEAKGWKKNVCMKLKI